ncbi:GNAT family N-acetyltransferase [Nostocales cyanobacterium HT-58-2]|nr:GNAT family N-acetyltransferase [Nostocales cyanobacterium HT-58-2]
MSEELLPGYRIRCGSTLDKAQLVKFMQRTYQEAFPQQDFSHLAQTVEQYLCRETPLWWVDFVGVRQGKNEQLTPSTPPIACLWVGNAINQVQGDRHAHIFLVYVVPEHRRRGIGTALMRYVEGWARARGDHRIGLQVFQNNTNALNLYNQLGYQTHSLWMVKSLDVTQHKLGVEKNF